MLAQSTHVRTLLKPSDLIGRRSLSHASRCASGSGSSIGARTFPPPYQTAIGRKSDVEGRESAVARRRNPSIDAHYVTRRTMRELFLSKGENEYEARRLWHRFRLVRIHDRSCRHRRATGDQRCPRSESAERHY